MYFVLEKPSKFGSSCKGLSGDVGGFGSIFSGEQEKLLPIKNYNFFVLENLGKT